MDDMVGGFSAPLVEAPLRHTSLCVHGPVGSHAEQSQLEVTGPKQALVDIDAPKLGKRPSVVLCPLLESGRTGLVGTDVDERGGHRVIVTEGTGATALHPQPCHSVERQ